MRQIVINEFMTLDGVIQAPGGPDEDRTGNFKYGGWVANLWDDKMNETMQEFSGKDFELLLGRKTYEIFAAHWPYHKEDDIGERLNKSKKYVASKTLDKLDWENSHLIKGDIVKELIKLKQQEGPEIQLYGSANLVQTLLKNNLVDVIQLFIFPIVIGKGKRLFQEGVVPSQFQVSDSKVSSTGTIIAKYKPMGDIKVATIGGEAKPSKEEMARREKWAVHE
jgi:dihydrofolate reductase